MLEVKKNKLVNTKKILKKLLTKILVGANITLTDTNKYLLSNKKGYRIAWTVRPIPNNQNKRRLLHYYSKTANKKKGGFYYVKNLFNKLRKVQRRSACG